MPTLKCGCPRRWRGVPVCLDRRPRGGWRWSSEAVVGLDAGRGGRWWRLRRVQVLAKRTATATRSPPAPLVTSSPARPPPSRYPHAGSGPSQGAQPPISGHRHPRNRGRAALDRPVGLLGSASNPPSATVGLPPRSAACQRPSALGSGRAPLDRPAPTPQGPPARPCPRPAVPAPR